MSMSILCQQCKEPLQLDASLVDLAPSAYDMIVSTLPQPSAPAATKSLSDAEKLAQLNASPAMKAAWERAHINPGSLSPRAQGKLPQRGSPLPNESFVVLQDSVIRAIPPQGATSNSPSRRRKTNAQAPVDPLPLPEHPNPSPWSDHLRSTQKLFSVLSSRTDVDHPLCAECTQILLNALQRQLEETKRERDGYIAFEKEVRREKEREVQGMSKEEAERKIQRLKEDEETAVEQLMQAEREREELDDELRLLEAEEKQLEAEEAEFWHMHNDRLLEADQQAEQLATLRAAYAADSATLEKLERTNVYNDAFCIGHDGAFGTINGLRLGRMPGIPVEWAEINAAWGQALLLLYTIARKLDYHFENYRLVPMGSFSRIERTTGDKASYELYGSGDLHFVRLLHNRRFDLGMVAFLDCLKHLMEYIGSQDPSVDFPHEIVKDKIGDVSVKLQFNQEEAWTRSLRHVLLALKICLKWATNGING
ncbi:APG6-domain-containing protein [Schizophyllum commune H4-8]|uniref:APG6-domain-containing protein n=1 Tax=Schizophyllum commune (strain H4-8 / FGSC 9210) TaxID=578458 RepID=UPI00215F2CE0|nr:APG6-domain-containing protein [Schizophyllum commune H4-8]KAI5890536.1 APG6-domain-containing protein [Schizophyllum commune H4-8]